MKHFITCDNSNLSWDIRNFEYVVYYCQDMIAIIKVYEPIMGDTLFIITDEMNIYINTLFNREDVMDRDFFIRQINNNHPLSYESTIITHVLEFIVKHFKNKKKALSEYFWNEIILEMLKQ